MLDPRAWGSARPSACSSSPSRATSRSASRTSRWPFRSKTLPGACFSRVAGALVVRLGFRRVLVVGAAFIFMGLLVLAVAQSLAGFAIGAGILIGASLACTASAMAQATAARVVPASIRSLTLGVITGAGTLGAIVAAPLAQAVTVDHGWRAGVLAAVCSRVAALASDLDRRSRRPRCRCRRPEANKPPTCQRPRCCVPPSPARHSW